LLLVCPELGALCGRSSCRPDGYTEARVDDDILLISTATRLIEMLGNIGDCRAP